MNHDRHNRGAALTGLSKGGCVSVAAFLLLVNTLTGIMAATVDFPVPGTREEWICSASAIELAERIRDGGLTSEEVVSQFLRRITVLNPQIGAVAFLNPKALDEAREADRLLSAFHAGQGSIPGSGTWYPGRLHGVPFTVSDLFDTAGMPSTAGTEGRRDYIPERDAIVVSRLRAEGAILLGRTVSSELGLGWNSGNRIHGSPANPYDKDRRAGGSNCGGAALVAACGTPFDIGIDLGGGILLSAHFNGIFGLKATWGRIPLTGSILSAVPKLTAPGILARSVEDIQLVLGILSGSDSSDPFSSDQPLADFREVNTRQLRLLVRFENSSQQLTSLRMSRLLNRTRDHFVSRGVPVINREMGSRRDHTGYDQFNKLFFLNSNGFRINKLLNESKTETTRLSNELHTYVQHWKEYLANRKQGHYFEFNAMWYPYWFPAYLSGDLADAVIGPVYSSGSPTDHEVIDPARIGVIECTISGCPAISIPAGTDEFGMPLGIAMATYSWKEAMLLALAQSVQESGGGWSAPGVKIRVSGTGQELSILGTGKLLRAEDPGGPWQPASLSDAINQSPRQFFKLKNL